MKSRHLLKHFRNHLFEPRSIPDQIEEYILLSLVSVLGIGLMFALWQRMQLNQQLIQNFHQQLSLLQHQYHLRQTEK